MQIKFSLGDGPEQSPCRDKTPGERREDNIGSSRLGCYIFKKLVPLHLSVHKLLLPGLGYLSYLGRHICTPRS